MTKGDDALTERGKEMKIDMVRESIEKDRGRCEVRLGCEGEEMGMREMRR